MQVHQRYRPFNEGRSVRGPPQRWYDIKEYSASKSSKYNFVAKYEIGLYLTDIEEEHDIKKLPFPNILRDVASQIHHDAN